MVVDGETPVTVINHDVVDLLKLPEKFLKAETERKLKEIEERRRRYLAGRDRVDVAGRTAIIVDDGIATGATIRAALRGIRRANPGRLVLAVPMAPSDTIEELRREADDCVCLEAPSDFRAISLYYADFRQVSDEEVVALLAEISPSKEATRTMAA